MRACSWIKKANRLLNYIFIINLSILFILNLILLLLFN